MEIRLSPEATAAAEEYLDRLPAAAKTRGEDYFQRGRVKGFTGSRDRFVAEVVGTRTYHVLLNFKGGKWYAACDCPVEGDCKHEYSAMRELLFRSEVPLEELVEAEPAQLKPATLVQEVERRLGRKLKAAEQKQLRDVQQLYREHGHDARVPEFALAPLAGRLSSGWSWERFEIWPSPPSTVWEAWLYVAHFLKERRRPWPDILRQATTEEEIDALVRPWLRRKEIEQWTQKLAKVTDLDVEEPASLIDLRAVFDAEGVRLETRERAEASWEPVKKGRYAEWDRVASYKSLVLANDESALLWAAFRKGAATGVYPLPYDSKDSRPALNELLRNPLLTERVATAGRDLFRRPAEPLQWRMEAPETPDGDYRVALTLPDGTPPPPPLVVLDGAKTLYVTADTIYEAPPRLGLSMDPAQPNQIPATAFETPGGVALLERLGLPMPERLQGRIEKRSARLVVEASIDSLSPAPEHLVVRFFAEWDGSSADEQYGPHGWAPRHAEVLSDGSYVLPTADEEAGEPSAATAAGAPGEEPILRLDRSRLRHAPSLAEGLSLHWNEYEQAWTRRLQKHFPEQFSAWLEHLPTDLELRLSPELASLRDAPISAGIFLDIEPTGVDWFDVSARLDTADVELTPEEQAALLAAKGGWVRLGPKGWRRLALKWNETDEERLADLGLSAADVASNEPQRLHALQLAHESAARLLPEDRMAEIRRRVGELQARVTPDVPKAVQAELRPYQIEGFHFLAYLSSNRFGGVLADDMGLGKTLQTLTWLAWLREQKDFKGAPSLVVCPKSVMDNWRAEAARFVPELRVTLWRSGEKDEFLGQVKNCDLMVINHTQLRLLAQELDAVEWHAAIIDEAQAIKNPESQTAKSAYALKAGHRLALTGTPIENRLLDLWSIMAFAMPGVLGPRTRFARTYDRSDDPFARRRLAARVRPFLLRRTKEQVARDLPARIEEELLCEMEGKQATLYAAELKRARQQLLKLNTSQDLDRARFNILTSLLRLRQISCHPALVDDKAAKSSSAKLDALLDVIEPLVSEGRKVLVFSQFVTMLELIQRAIEARGWKQFLLTGSTEDRGELVNAFQTTEGGAVFLLSLKAGGAGLNLTAASYVVLYDPWWNPAVENQAIDRTHRIGQTSTVIAYRLLVKGTIEEKIRALQRQKRALADDILGEEAFAKALTLDDFRFLLGEE